VINITERFANARRLLCQKPDREGGLASPC